MHDENKCTAVVCSAPPTMKLRVRVTSPHVLYVDEIPYCDEHIGWFYRSFSRKSYKGIDVLGIDIIVSVDEEFGVNDEGLS